MSESQKKNLVSSLPRENPTLLDFDNYYHKEDPWSVRNSIEEEVKKIKINYVFKDSHFKCGLDIGCGEGHFTAALNFVQNFDAIDISEVALNRAKKYYQHINFIQADVRNLGHIKNNYDFISCLEVLYYVSSDSEREQILSNIKSKKGGGNVYFVFL